MKTFRVFVRFVCSTHRRRTGLTVLPSSLSLLCTDRKRGRETLFLHKQHAQELSSELRARCARVCVRNCWTQLCLTAGAVRHGLYCCC